MSFVPARPTALLRVVVAAGLLSIGAGGVLPVRAVQRAVPMRPIEINVPPSRPTDPTPNAARLELGIDVLEADRFAILRGKRIGLLTHPAGVNRRGVSTIEVLRRAPGLKLVALFGVEHGLRGEYPANRNYPDGTDRETGLPLFSLHSGRTRKPQPDQLRGIDVLVIDLQDIGTRSYTYVAAMKLALEACFENGKEVIVLDRPNPLGGLKVDGPILDAEYAINNYVGPFPMPYVHGLTIGELATMAKATPGWLNVPDPIRQRGKLTVVAMRGWRRSQRWPDLGLPWEPTSPLIQDFAAVEGYPITGLGCEIGGWVHGIGRDHPFRGLGFRGRTPEQVKAALEALRLPGLAFRIREVRGGGGRGGRGVYVEITDWDACRPTELSFHLMRLAVVWSSRNPFLAAPLNETELFNKHCGSRAWWAALGRDGAKVDVARFTTQWRRDAAEFQQRTQRFWLYAP